MSELLLNLVWVCVALFGAAALWRGRSHPHIAQHRFLAFVALGCVMFLLFPVISATDDLHSSEFTADEAYSTQKSIRTVPCAKQNAACPVILAFVVIASSDLLLAAAHEALPPIVIAIDRGELSYLRAIPDRAPPSYSPLA